VKVGQPIDLRDHAASYAENKRDAVQNINAMLESSVRENLDAMGAACALVRE
jgi:hypothetical protein